MKLSGAQIRSLIEKKEDERVEFKRAASELPDNLWETYSAFCNTDGGTIILGIREGKNKTYSIEGVSAAHKLIDDTPVHKALREVLANALIHADYHGRRGIVVEKHFRTITFSNPGTMRISKSVAVAGGTSDARNTAIFNIFALVDIGERSGMGLANLHGLWKKYGYAEPKITESYDPDRTVIVVTTDDDTVNDTVTRPENGAEPDQKCSRSAPEVDNKVDNKVDNNPEGGIKVDNKVDNKTEGDNKHDGGKEELGKKSLNELPASCRQVLKALSEDGSFTQQALIRKLNLSRAAITKAIATLIKERYIIRRGARKNGYWEVLDR